MTERPILFKGAMVRALRDGSKTQTRRIVKGADQWPANAVRAVVLETRGTAMAVDAQRCTYGPEIKCPYGQPNDRLWVRETHAPQADCWGAWERRMMTALGEPPILHYKADGEDRPFIEKWRPSIHMPRWASRITLEIVSVRVERLQDISEADAAAEGLLFSTEHIGHWSANGERWHITAVNAYRDLWEQINGAGSWDANPWVWVLDFKKATP